MNLETHEGSGLTKNQFFMWLGDEASPGVPLFNELVVFVLEGSIDRPCFGRAVQAVVDRTDALHTVVRRVNGLPRAEVLDRFDCPTPCIDLSMEEDPDGALDRWAREHVDSTIDLACRPVDSTLLKLAPTRYAWALRQHHVFTDATSIAIVFQRVGECYERLVAGEDDVALGFPRYTDYVEHEKTYRLSERYESCGEFWESRTTRPPDPVTFYGGRTLTSEHGLRRERVKLQLGERRSAAIRAMAQTEGIRFFSDDLSIFCIFAAALYTYLFRLSGQRTIAIGAPWRNRRRPFRETVGLLMEQDPFVLSLDPDDTFEALIGKVHKEARSVMRHLPYAAGNPRGRVYDVSLNYANASVGTFAGMETLPLSYRPSHGEGSINLQIQDFAGSGELSLSFEFNAALFTAFDREAAVAHFMSCLTACIDDPGHRIGSVSLLTDGERDLLSEWNETAAGYPRERTVVELFEAQAARRPTAVAVRSDDGSLSYGALDRRATALAERLRDLGVAPGVLVGVCLERSTDMLVGLLGILKAGGAYVPLDPSFPAERLAFMLADSGAPLMVTETRSLGTVDPGACRVVCLDTLPHDEAAGHVAASDESATPRSAEAGQGLAGGRATSDDLAYVLYTSGSTGRPKGVEIPHRNLTNFLWAMRSKPGLAEDDVLLAVTTLSFDIAGLELFLPLICGAQIELVDRRLAADGRLLRARLESARVSVMQASPATWRMLLDAGWAGTPGLKALIGGETLPAELVKPLLERTASLWNMYGPTETTIWSSVQRVTEPEGEITVGTPIANTRFYVLDAEQRPVPPRVAGELYIGGDGVARGYRARPELTAASFVADPFVATPGARMYRTGDLVKYQADGQVVHLGRLDHQVKIRGFRIELGEIESALGIHASLRQAVVVSRTGPAGQAVLVAYCVPCREEIPSPSDLRHHLRRTLPEYMLPRQFVTLDELPLTPNGKIDRARLPELGTTRTNPTTGTPSGHPLEAQVAALFAEVLKIPVVSADDDFFDLSGDSLFALQLVMRLEEKFQCELPLQVLYEASTVAKLSERIGEITRPDLPIIDSASDGGESGRDARSATERKLAGIWTTVLGIETVSRDDNFVELQGSRALVTEMLTAARREFGVIAEGISAIDFEAEPTIAALARIIDSSIQPTPTLVVPLQTKGSRRPLFLVHAGGGYVFFYRALAARLAPDQPVYGVRAMTKHDGRGSSFERSASVEELAALYIEEIQAIQRHGPYTLGGACFGGVIAFEMAQQLLAKGESIAGPILLFDAFIANSDNPKFSGGDTARPVTALARLAVHLDPTYHPGHVPTPTVPHLLGRAIVSPGVILNLAAVNLRVAARRMNPARSAQIWYLRMQTYRLRREALEAVQLNTMALFLKATFRLLDRYRPIRYPGAAVLFKAESGPDAEPGWRPLFIGSLDVHTLPGSHLDMMEEPAVVQTAALLSRHLAGNSVPSGNDGHLAKRY